MKKRLIQVISLSFLMALIFSLTVPAGAAIAPGTDAEMRAISYFQSEKVVFAAAGGGKIVIEIDVRAQPR